MPHMLSMPQSGFQALILCGPGIGLSTFTSIPDEYPKALVSVANRPMVWYVLDWCYRMGVTSKHALNFYLYHFKLDTRLLQSFYGPNRGSLIVHSSPVLKAAYLTRVQLTKFPRYNAHHATRLKACSVGRPCTESVSDIPSVSICRHTFSVHSRSHNPDRRTTSPTTGTGRNQVRFSSSSLRSHL
jgi:translation initiation factor eIF-2B subunit gamma